MKLTNILLTILVLNLPQINGGRVLFLSPLGTKSHKISFMGVAEALAEKGHHVTMVSPYKPHSEIKNMKEVVVQNYTVDHFLANAFEEKGTTVMRLFLAAPQFCIQTLGQQQIQDLKNEKFDVIIINIFFSHCYLSFVHYFKVPFIYASPMGLVGQFNSIVGNIDFPAISGNTMSESNIPITFLKRLKATFINLIYNGLNDYYLEPQMHSQCLKSGLCPLDMPPISEFNKNVSLTIINSVRALENPPRPAMPNVIYAGGAYIKPSKPLPKNLEDWVEGSGEEGFIFFSLGSSMNPSFLPEEYRKILVNVFGSLKQRVLWKWNEETMPYLPDNVKLQKWLPQTDLLGHKKIKLFITHGGLLSTLEASYFGVPVIGMPIFSDQFANMESVEMEGCGRVMDWKKLEENIFRNLVLEVLKDNQITENMKKKSELMRDNLVSPDEEAAYWVEYVMRHKGAPHIMSPLRTMRWYEVYNMDVWAFIFSLSTGILWITWVVIKFIFRTIFSVEKSKNEKKKIE